LQAKIIIQKVFYWVTHIKAAINAIAAGLTTKKNVQTLKLFTINLVTNPLICTVFVGCLYLLLLSA